MASDTGQPNTAFTPPPSASPSPHNAHDPPRAPEAIMTISDTSNKQRKTESTNTSAPKHHKASASSVATPGITLQYAHFTPETVRSDLDATEHRAKKRKAEYEQEEAAKRARANPEEAPPGPKPKNKGGRPRTAHLKEKKPPKGRTILKKSKPLFGGKRQVPQDAWNLIFERCSPEFLLSARKVSQDFRHALNMEHVWRNGRLNTFGVEHPPCPSTLNEMQYADLLFGLGCQARGCPNKMARKTYWAYQRRWCDNCLHQQVMEVSHTYSHSTSKQASADHLCPV